jgi:hypothetical protein
MEQSSSLETNSHKPREQKANYKVQTSVSSRLAISARET